MIKAKVNLYVLSFNKTSLEYEVLSTDRENLSVPHFELNANTDINKELHHVFEQHVDLSAQFIYFILSDIFTFDKELNIEYYCLIPYSIQTKNSTLININAEKIYSKNLQKILQRL